MLFAGLCLYVLVNSRVRGRGFERGELRVERVQPWATHGGSTATTSTSYKVHGTVVTPSGTYPATSIDVYDSGVQKKKGTTVPCRFDPKDPGRVTLTLSDHSGIGPQDVLLTLVAAACLAYAWFTW
ncbi:MAG: hypothetical protein DCC50_00720 [Acidobacteria bacterium]|nr:MAG: hypothetical protein DCC50_00720 [Acidobacteriota bacterium]